MRSAFSKEMFRAMWDVHPVLKEIKVRPQTEGKEASYERRQGEVVETDYKLRSVQRQWKIEDARGLTPEVFLQTAADIGVEMGEKMVADILVAVTSATKEVGNVVDCEGKGMTFEKFLEMASSIHTEFDASGRPFQKSFLASPEICLRFEKDMQEWTADPVKNAALEEVAQKHWKEFNEREACRRMVD